MGCLDSPPENLDALRKLTAPELEKLGQQSLLEHLRAQAAVAHAKYAPITHATLDALLRDRDCVRYPVRLLFEFGPMAIHQFAQPELDWRDTKHQGRVLYLRPLLRHRPQLVPLAVIYMIPIINYGDIVPDEHCLTYGATVLGLTEREYYQQLCALGDLVGAEPRLAEPR